MEQYTPQHYYIQCKSEDYPKQGGIFSLFHMPPCVLDVDDLWKTSHREVYYHQIEAKRISGQTESGHPDRRSDGDRLAFPPSHRIEAPAEQIGLPGFDFHEGDQAALAGYQVEVGVAEAEAMGFDEPATGFEIPGGSQLAGKASAMAGVTPLGDGSDDVGRVHGPTMARGSKGQLAKTTQTGTKHREGVTPEVAQPVIR